MVHLIICVLCDWLEWLLWFWCYDTQLKTALLDYCHKFLITQPVYPVLVAGLTSCKRTKTVWRRDDRNTVTSDQECQNQMREHWRCSVYTMLPFHGICTTKKLSHSLCIIIIYVDSIQPIKVQYLCWAMISVRNMCFLRWLLVKYMVFVTTLLSRHGNIHMNSVFDRLV